MVPNQTVQTYHHQPPTEALQQKCENSDAKVLGALHKGKWEAGRPTRGVLLKTRFDNGLIKEHSWSSKVLIQLYPLCGNSITVTAKQTVAVPDFIYLPSSRWSGSCPQFSFLNKRFGTPFKICVWGFGLSAISWYRSPWNISRINLFLNI